jgi:hypothetical protein
MQRYLSRLLDRWDGDDSGSMRRLINYRLKILFPQTNHPITDTMLLFPLPTLKRQPEIMKEALLCYQIIKQSTRRGRTLIYLQPRMMLISSVTIKVSHIFSSRPEGKCKFSGWNTLKMLRWRKFFVRSSCFKGRRVGWQGWRSEKSSQMLLRMLIEDLFKWRDIDR